MRITRRFTCFIIFLSIILLILCQPFYSALAANRPNTLTIWGSLSKKYIQMHINNYEAVDPQTKVIYTEYDFFSLAEAFRERAHQGLGPDAVILPEREIPQLIKLNLIQKLDSYNLDTTNWHPKSLISVRGEGGSIYGIPLGFQPMALCYNRTLVDTPATTLDELLAQSRNGTTLGIETRFLKNMWGIGLFGGQFFNSDNQFVLQPENLINWLNWLQEAENNPVIYFDSSSEFLYSLFASGKLAYFPCWNFEFRFLKEKLQDKLGIASLPRTSTGVESPYLEIDNLLVNLHANPKQKQLAARFGQFLTQKEQQIHLIKEDSLYVLPINVQIELEKNLFPILHTLSTTVKSGVVFPISEIYNLQRIRFYGDQLFNQVLNGILSPEEGVQQFFERIKNPPPNEKIITSVSTAGDKFGELVNGNTEPDLDYLSDFLRIFRATVTRPIVVLELFLVLVSVFATGILARRINEWLKNWLD